MKKSVAAVGVGLALLSGCMLYARRAAQVKRDAVYQIPLAQFQRGLRLGASRSEVRKYLDSQNAQYSDTWDIAQKIGEDPGDSFVCDRWSVFIALKFNQLP